MLAKKMNHSPSPQNNFRFKLINFINYYNLRFNQRRVMNRGDQRLWSVFDLFLDDLLFMTLFNDLL